MSTNKTISTDNTFSLKVLSFSSKIPGYEKIKISARKMTMSPEKNDDGRIWGTATTRPPGSYTCVYHDLHDCAVSSDQSHIDLSKNVVIHFHHTVIIRDRSINPSMRYKLL